MTIVQASKKTKISYSTLNSFVVLINQIQASNLLFLSGQPTLIESLQFFDINYRESVIQ